MTEFYLLNDVNFPSDYTDVVDFENIGQQRSYFLSRIVTGFDTSTQYIRGPKSTLRVNISKIIIEKYGYFTFKNVEPNETFKEYYAFITNTTYVDPVTTQIDYDVDVYQTYMFDFQIKDTFIDRQHEDRFYKQNDKLFPIFNLQTENISTGEELIVKNKEKIYDENFEGKLYNVVWACVIAGSPLEGEAVYGDQSTLIIRDIGLPYYVYFIPIILSGLYDIRPTCLDYNNAEVNLFHFGTNDRGQIAHLLKDERVLSIRYVPYAFFDYFVSDPVINPLPSQNKLRFSLNTTGHSCSLIKRTYLLDGLFERHYYLFNSNYIGTFKTDVSSVKFLYNEVLSKDLQPNIELEIKLKQRPYRSYTVTNYQIEPLTFGEENIGRDKKILKFIQSVDFNAKQKIYLDDYLGDNGKLYCAVDTKIQEIPLMTDPYLRYIENNRASATTGLAINKGMAIAGAGLGLLGMLTPLPTAYLGLGMGISGAMAVKNELLNQSNLKQAPDTMRDSGNNLVFDLTDDNLILEVVTREIKDEYKQILFNYLMRFGYKSNKFGVPNLRSRYYYNFIKTITVQIECNLPQTIKDRIRNIYINGTRLWHYRVDNINPAMFDYSKENLEVSLI